MTDSLSVERNDGNRKRTEEEHSENPIESDSVDSGNGCFG